MKQKNLILLLAAAGIGFYLFTSMRKKRRGTVSVEDAEIISEREFIEQKPSLIERAPSIIESVSKITATLFPKKEQKQAVKKLQAAPKADPKFATAQSKGLATFIQAAQQASTKKKKKAKVGSMDNISILY